MKYRCVEIKECSFVVRFTFVLVVLYHIFLKRRILKLVCNSNKHVSLVKVFFTFCSNAIKHYNFEDSNNLEHYFFVKYCMVKEMFLFFTYYSRNLWTLIFVVFAFTD